VPAHWLLYVDAVNGKVLLYFDNRLWLWLVVLTYSGVGSHA
jgi:hypothetical protein